MLSLNRLSRRRRRNHRTLGTRRGGALRPRSSRYVRLVRHADRRGRRAAFDLSFDYASLDGAGALLRVQLGDRDIFLSLCGMNRHVANARLTKLRCSDELAVGQ